MPRVMMQVLLLCAAVAMAAGPSAAPAALAPVTTNEAAVTVKVTPRNLAGATWEFDVVFDTHSQELTDDVVKAAVLLAADGSEVAPLEWKGAAPGGHHRAGVLRFKALNPAPALVVLRITRTGEAKPRVFQWKLR
jgi:hypothetical protein